MLYSTCHPPRPAFSSDGLCRRCRHRAEARAQRQERAAEQRAMSQHVPTPHRAPERQPGPSMSPPEACPKCQNRCLRHYEGAPEVGCMLCGYEFTIITPEALAKESLLAIMRA